MLKTIAVVLLFMSGVAEASTDSTGIYRDKNFNILMKDGSYSCKVFPYNKRIKDDFYSQPSIGEGTIAIKSDKHSDSKRMFINFDNGTKVVTPFLVNHTKGSTETVYTTMTRDDLYILGITEPMGMVAIIKKDTKGNETSVAMAECILQ
ncbi:hypothetical protein J8V57_01220 [Xenorhabdus sp. PB61.4]|uniref:hypothetical protein n=1 Tax=Xenorhabdus sp. PB61.4 TaxID=2788940 RepID=UPI001E3789D5|nr:hypothetical protein [Xenorhabdus sp. PB61.4]MCC8364910.1 hypothetical protein [Xenorhabdus sp. PB61.4]